MDVITQLETMRKNIGTAIDSLRVVDLIEKPAAGSTKTTAVRKRGRPRGSRNRRYPDPAQLAAATRMVQKRSSRS